jgi:hypothetical protein
MLQDDGVGKACRNRRCELFRPRCGKLRIRRDARVAAGSLPGPRMRIASPIVENARWLAAVKRMIDQSGTPWRLHERVAPASPEEAVRIVDTFVKLGADHIKVRNWPCSQPVFPHEDGGDSQTLVDGSSG